MNLRRIFQKVRQARATPETTVCRELPPGSLFRTKESVKAYVESELKRVVPEGWAVKFGDGMYRFPPNLWWVIEKTGLAKGEWPHKDYRLEVSQDLEFFVIFYDNKDIGPLSLWHVLQTAVVIQRVSLEPHGHFGGFNLGECVEYVMKNLKPNEWGYT